MVCLFFVIKIPCTGYPYCLALCETFQEFEVVLLLLQDSFLSLLLVPSQQTIVILKLYEYIFFIALPASVNSQCKIVERAEWSWKHCTRLQKLGLKEKKSGFNQPKDLMAHWFPPGNKFLSTSTLCQLGPTLSCRQSCEMSISCKDKAQSNKLFLRIYCVQLLLQKKTPEHMRSGS